MPNASEVDAGSLMIVCVNLEPGKYLPTHRDSNEELLVVTVGTVEATVGDETVELPECTCTVVPVKEPHSIENVGD